MIGVLLMSHGPLAAGMLKSAELFFGENIKQVEALCLEAEDDLDGFDEQIETAIARLDSGAGVIVLCDLLGGTPCNRSARFANKNVQVITGMNFSMILELLGKRMSAKDLNDIDIESLIKVGQRGIISLNQFLRNPLD